MNAGIFFIPLHLYDGIDFFIFSGCYFINHEVFAERQDLQYKGRFCS